ncbi:hypothetical protein HDU82_008900, partial [Entophlyctis luteolus]
MIISSRMVFALVAVFMAVVASYTPSLRSSDVSQDWSRYDSTVPRMSSLSARTALDEIHAIIRDAREIPSRRMSVESPHRKPGHGDLNVTGLFK